MIETTCVPQAMDALRAGDIEQHNSLVAEAAASLHGCDAVMLAQFSTSIARDRVAARLRQPVLTSPASAVRKLKLLVATGDPV